MGNDNGNTVFSSVVGCGCLITMLIPRKPVCGATNSLSGCSFRLEGKDGPFWRTSRMFGMWFSLPVLRRCCQSGRCRRHHLFRRRRQCYEEKVKSSAFRGNFQVAREWTSSL